MLKKHIILITVVFFLTLCSSGCSHHHGDGDEDDDVISAPIHVDLPTNHIQHKVGLSGFIFGTFLLLNAYVIIASSMVILIVKDQTIKKIVDTARMVLQMLNPGGDGGGKAGSLLTLLEKGDSRTQYGSIGLVVGLILAYIGAYIAM